MSHAPSSPDHEPPRLKFLRWLVIVLTITMIGGLITIVTLIVMTFMGSREAPAGGMDVPDRITLPDGQRLDAVTQGDGWTALVTTDEAGVQRILIVDPDSGDIRKTVPVN